MAQTVKNLPAMQETWVWSPGEGNGYPLQYSHLENSMNRGAWRAAVHRVAKSWTWFSDWACARMHADTHTHTCTPLLGAGALGRPRGMEWGGRREEGSGWGTHVCLWQIHFDIWQNQYNLVKFKNKIKLRQKKSVYHCLVLEFIRVIYVFQFYMMLAVSMRKY